MVISHAPSGSGCDCFFQPLQQHLLIIPPSLFCTNNKRMIIQGNELKWRTRVANWSLICARNVCCTSISIWEGPQQSHHANEVKHFMKEYAFRFMKELLMKVLRLIVAGARLMLMNTLYSQYIMCGVLPN